MKINARTTVMRIIVLDQSERFRTRIPGLLFVRNVDTVLVYPGHFFLAGHDWLGVYRRWDTHGFRSVDEVSTMPTYVADQVRNVLDELKS